MPVTVNITFENWIFKWILHLCDPSYQSHCGKRQCGTLKWILYFISILKKLCIFSLTIFFPWHCPLCVGKVSHWQSININNTKQQGIHMRLSPIKCYNNMAKSDGQGFERIYIRFEWRPWGRNQSPSFQWYDAHVSVLAADAPSLCWHDATGPGSAASAVFLCSGQFWSVLGIHWRHSTRTRSFVAEGERRHKEGGRAMWNK